MIYRTPRITETLQRQLGELDEARRALGRGVSNPSPWLGSLRRLVKASSVESSTSIEGFSLVQHEAVAIVSGEQLADSDDENRMAVACYARAMDHVGVMAIDPALASHATGLSVSTTRTTSICCRTAEPSWLSSLPSPTLHCRNVSTGFILEAAIRRSMPRSLPPTRLTRLEHRPPARLFPAVRRLRSVCHPMIR